MRAEYFLEVLVRYVEWCSEFKMKTKIFFFSRIFGFGNLKLLMHLARGASVEWEEQRLDHDRVRS